MRLRDREESLSPEAEAELTALERVLAGEDPGPGYEELARLAGDLRAERPEPDAEWTREIDLRAAEILTQPRRTERLRERLRRPSGWLAPAGALATLAVVVAIGIGTLGDGERIEQNATEAVSPPGPVAEDTAVAPPGGAGARETRRLQDDALAPLPVDPPGGTDLAPGREQRVQDRSATLTLGSAPEDVAGVADEAISITEDVGGIVVSSELTERDGQSRADLRLSIPAGELDGTLDRLTDLAEVTFFREGARDITGPWVSARERLADARQERARLLEALAEAGDGAEAESLRKQLRDARQRISRAQARFERVQRQGSFAEVGVAVEGRDGAGDGSWSIGDAADDALAALERLAGIALVAAAIVLPLGLLVALIVALALLLRRRRRDRALDG